MEVNRTPTGTDDYVTWAPTFCRARAVGAGADVTVVLTNDPPGAVPGRGDVMFAPFQSPWPANTTATQPTLVLTLPQDGSWVDFVIAGEFGKPSSNDKDAVIEVHEGTATGSMVGTQALMVRIRKNANDLSASERDRFLSALETVHTTQAAYHVYQEIHSIAGGQAHGGTAFLPWHRLFVLRLERALQSVDPSVALPYWKFDVAAANLFQEDWMGANQPQPSGPAPVTFVASNPLDGWTIDGLTPIERGPNTDHLGVSGVELEADTLTPSDFVDFRTMEVNPHGSAHVWLGRPGGWVGYLDTAVRDPAFFLLHSNVERLWAKWQWVYDRFGNTVADYDAPGSFSDTASAPPLKGHYRNDTMWPWNGLTGADPSGNPLATRPSLAPGGPFPPAAPFTLGPPAQPTPGDVIDYMGRAGPSKGLGYAYDDVPYGP